MTSSPNFLQGNGTETDGARTAASERRRRPDQILTRPHGERSTERTRVPLRTRRTMSLECASSEDPLDLLLADDNLELLLSTTDIEMAPADEDEKPSSPVVKTESFPIEMEVAEPTCVPAIGGAAPPTGEVPARPKRA